MTKVQILKKIAFIVFVPSVIVGSYYGYKFIKKKLDDKKLDTLTQQMRDKYTEITSFEDFYAGVPYQPSGKYMGYELAKLKDVKDIDKKITLDELKTIYEISKSEAGKINDEKGEEFLKILHKVYA